MPAEALKRLSFSDDIMLRAAVTANPAITKATLRRLSRDPEAAVRAAAAANPANSRRTARRLLADPDQAVAAIAAAAAQHPACPPAEAAHVMGTLTGR